MPRPVTAPPRVIVLSSGTTSGIRPCGSVASHRSSYVVIPPTTAVRVAGSTWITRAKADTSRLTRWLCPAESRNLKRLDVGFASRTETPAGTAA